MLLSTAHPLLHGPPLAVHKHDTLCSTEKKAKSGGGDGDREEAHPWPRMPLGGTPTQATPCEPQSDTLGKGENKEQGSPMASIASAGGPTKAMPSERHRAAKLEFSDRKP